MNMSSPKIWNDWFRIGFDCIVVIALFWTGFSTDRIQKFQTEPWLIFYRIYLPVGMMLLFSWRYILQKKCRQCNRVWYHCLLSYSPAIIALFIPLHHHYIHKELMSPQFHGFLFFLVIIAFNLDCIYSIKQYVPNAAILTEPGNKQKKILGTAIFITFLLILGVMSPFMCFNHHPTGDEPHYLLISHSLIYDHDLNLKNNYEAQDFKVFYPGSLKPQPADTVRGDVILSNHSPILSLILLPGYYLAGRLGAVWSINVIMSFLLTVIFIYCLPRCGLVLSLLLCFVSVWSLPFSQYAFKIFPEVLAGLLAFLIYYRASHHTLRFSDYFIIPLMLIMLILLKIRYLPVAICLFFFFLLIVKQSSTKCARNLVIFFLVTGLVVLFIFVSVKEISFLFHYFHLIQDAHRIMTRWDVTSISAALGLLFDQEFGLFFNAPLVFLAFLITLINRNFITFLRSRHSLYLIFVMSFFYYLVLVKFKSMTWHGGWAPPLRFLFILFPFWVPLLGECFRLRQSFVRAILIISGIGSITISFYMLNVPSLAYNTLDGSARLLEYLGNKMSMNVPAFFPSFVRPNIAIYCWILVGFVFIMILIRKVRLVPSFTSVNNINHETVYRDRTQTSMTVVTLLLCVAVGFCICHFLPTLCLEAEDRLEFQKHPGRFFPSEMKAEHLRKPLYRCGWELNVNSSLQSTFLTYSRKNLLVIWAKGSPAIQTWPLMMINVDGKSVGSCFVVTNETMPFPHRYKKIAKDLDRQRSIEYIRWQKYDFPVTVKPGLHYLSVTFTNDYYDQSTEQDRNLIIDKIEIIPFMSMGNIIVPISLFPHFLYGEIN